MFGLCTEGNADWYQVAQEYPSRTPLYCAILKSSFFLPPDIVDDALKLLNDMYGEVEYPWHEVNDFEQLHEFKRNRDRLFFDWLAEKKINSEKLDPTSEVTYWFDFHRELQGSYWFDRLNSVFSYYQPDDEYC